MAASVVLLNAGRWDWDAAIDWASLAASGAVTRHADGCEAGPDVAARTKGATVVVTKEMPVSAAMIAEFDDSVRLIAEAGTGFNNIGELTKQVSSHGPIRALPLGTEAVAIY